jgi:impB/mucB/samB family
VNSYKAVSSRSEKVVYGGGGLQNELSQESTSYPTPPEMKSMDLNAFDHNAVTEERILTLSETKTDSMEMQDIELPSQLSPLRPGKSPDQSSRDLQNPVAPISISNPLQLVGMIFPNARSSEGLSLRTSNRQGHQTPGSKEIFQTEDSSPITRDINTTASLLPTEALSELKQQDHSIAPKVLPSEDAAAVSAAHNAAILANPSLRSSTAVNPDFLRSYFDQSRLHHLSAWKADLKNQMQQLTMQKPPRSRKSGPRWIMHVDFDCFFCSVSLVSRPELKEKPVCVGHGGGRSGEIASCNYPARKFGVHNGMR